MLLSDLKKLGEKAYSFPPPNSKRLSTSFWVILCLFVFLIPASAFAYLLIKQANNLESNTPINSRVNTYESKLLHQVHLTYHDDCADMVVTTICKNGECQDHVTGVMVMCQELANKIYSQD